MRRLVMIAALACGPAAAQEPPLPGLLPDHVAQSLIASDPLVGAARAEAAGLREDAQLQRRSPYEFSARATAQRRRVDPGERFNEWNVALERPLRLPSKAAADGRIATALDDQARAHHGEAVHEAARTLLSLWTEWASAEQALLLAQASLAFAQENLAAVDKRVRAGDAAQLDASLARADVADQQRAAAQASTGAAVAWARLHARFPGLSRQYAQLPEPRPPGHDAAFWRARILEESDELKLAAAARERAAGAAQRASAERMPDPTVGVFTASEVGGRERLAGVSISVPVPGGRRSGNASRAASSAEAARLEYTLKRSEVDAGAAAEVARAQGAYAAWQSAQAGAREMDAAARLALRAYSLGEADLQSLLMARRQASVAALSELEARTAAVQALGALLVDAHLVWGLEHD